MATRDAQRYRKIYSYYRPVPRETVLGSGGVTEAVINGLDWKHSARAATTADITLSPAPASIDGVTLAPDDRVLVKDQTIASENGIYYYDAGSGDLLRTADGSDPALTSAAAIFIEGGTTNSDCAFVLVTADPITVGTTDLVWVKFAGAGSAIFTSSISPLAAKTNYSVSIDTDSRYAYEIGSDVFFFVSGSITASVDPAKAVFGGDTLVSGNLEVQNGINLLGDVFELSGTLLMTGTMVLTGVFNSGYQSFAVNDYTHTEGSTVFAADVYSVITSVDTGLNEITVEDASLFSVGDRVAYVHNASNNANQVHVTEVTNSDGISIVTVASSVSINGSSFNALSNAVIFGASVLVNLSQRNNADTFAHAEGSYTIASGLNSHAEGRKTAATGNHSHAEGAVSLASGQNSHAEGQYTVASGDHSHAEGGASNASGLTSHAEGANTTASGLASHAEGENTTASGDHSHAEGYLATASGDHSHAEGYRTVASGQSSHAGGEQTRASGIASHAEGFLTTGSANYSHAEGRNTVASGQSSHAEGFLTTGSGDFSHAEGELTIASGPNSHAEGYRTLANFQSAHAEGILTSGSAIAAHAEGMSTLAQGVASHTEGYLTTASVLYSHAEGEGTLASGRASHAEGSYTRAGGFASHAEGIFTFAAYASHAEGEGTAAQGFHSHAEGYYTTGSGPYSHAEGVYCVASGLSSHAEGWHTTGSANFAHAEGNRTLATGTASHAEGNRTLASGQTSHAEGDETVASGYVSHAEGYLTSGSGDYSHAEGYGTVASGTFSHAAGYFTIASGSAQTAVGKYNLRNNDFSLFVVGNGNGDADANRSDVFRVDASSIQVTGSFLAQGDRLEMTGTVSVTDGISGSLTKLTNGASYIIAGNNVTVASASNGSITITSIPASPVNSLQFNSAGAFGGDSDLTYNSTSNTLMGVNAVFSGDLTVNGTTTTINTTNLEVKDAVIGLGFASGTVSETAGDRGIIGGISGADHIALLWKNSQNEFSFGRTTSSATGSLPIPLTSYANLHVANMQADVVTASLGFSGSLTTLSNGDSYLVAGGNVSVVSASNGSVTLSAVPTSPSDSVQFNNGGSFGGSSNFNFYTVTNTLAVTGTIGMLGDVLPDADASHNLGSPAKRWANVYTGDLHLRNDRGDWTIVEERDFLCVVNNVTGKRYKMMLQEIADDHQ